MKDCKMYYGKRFEQMKKERENERLQKLREKNDYRESELKKQRENYAQNHQETLTRKRKNYTSNPTAKRKKARQHYQNNKDKLRKEARDKARAKKYDSDANMAKYEKSIEFGPEFVCVCCHGGFFEDQMLSLTDKRKIKIGSELIDKSCEIRKIREKCYDPRNKGRLFVCKTCFNDMTNKKDMPKRSIKNDLTVDDLEGYTSLENQLVAPCLHFMKIVKLPKSRMEAMKDRTVIVPLEPCDIEKNVQSLPRTLEEGAVVQVDFKRMKGMKNTHQSELVRPFKLYELLAKLKYAKNPFYDNVLQKCLYCDVEFQRDETNIYDHVKRCYMEFQYRGKNISTQITVCHYLVQIQVK